MCLGISTPDGGQTELIFVQEQVRLKKNGSKDVRTDLLISNTGLNAVNRFRIELPCRLMTYEDLTPGDVETQEAAYSRLCREQCLKIRVDTTRLISPDAKENWVYRILPYFSIVNWDSNTATIHCVRDEVEKISGLVKYGWKLAVSKEIGDDPSRWYTCFSNGITVVDYVTSDEDQSLKSGESMWISVEFTVPPGGMQHMPLPPLIKRLALRQWEFPFILMSPKGFSEWRTNQLKIFGQMRKPDESELKAAVAFLSQTLTHSNFALVRDWRLFLHWPRRISIQRIRVPREIVEPPSDNIIPNSKGRLFQKQYDDIPCEACRDEFWFGDFHGAAEPAEGFHLKFRAVVENWFYFYWLPWIGAVLGLFGASLALWRWYNYHKYGKG